MSAQYSPGKAAVFVGPHAVVMAAADRAAGLPALLEAPATPLGVLSVLSGGDVARLPEFAAVVVDGEDLVVMVRGGFRVDHGGEHWTGEEVATWREHRVAPGDGDVVIVHGDAPGEVVPELELPVSTGVVLAERVAWRPEDPASDAPAAPAAGAAQPASAPDPTATPSSDPDPEFTLVEADEDFDEVVGATVQGQRRPSTTPRDAEAVEAPGDHDGRTITAAQLQELRERRDPAPAAAAAPEVEATLTMSGGEAVDLVQPVIIGRSPHAASTSSSQLPRLVVVDDPYVSGTHLEVALEDGAVVAVDRSTNGTTLTRPGGTPQQLTKDERTVLGDGCVLGLSDDLTATVAVRGAAR